MDKGSSIFISAGDPSADYPGRNLIESITYKCGKVEIFGLGGPLMQEVGLKPIIDYKKLAVLGFWEILPNIKFFRKL